MALVMSAGASKVKKGNVIFDPRQVTTDNSFYAETVITASPAVTTSALPLSGTFNFDIDCSSIHRVHDMELAIDVTETGGSNDGVLAPCPYLVQKIEWMTKNGVVFATDFADTLFWSISALMPSSRVSEAFNRAVNINSSYYEGFVHPKSKTRRYRMPLFLHPWATLQPFVGNLKNAITARITWSSSVLVSGSGAFRIDGAFINIRQQRLPDSVLKLEQAKLNSKVIHRYIQPERLQFTSQTVTASTALSLDLSAFKGDCPFLIFGVRLSSTASSATDNGYLKTLDLGEGSTVDIQSPTGVSIYGGGNPVRCKLLEERYAEHLPSTQFMRQRRWYVVPFCGSISKAIQGVDTGSFNFNGSKYRLVITPGAAGVSAVQSIDLLTGSNSQGYYQLSCGGEATNPLAYNANVATIKAALEGLKCFKNWPAGPLTVTASGVLSSDATLTFASNMLPPNADCQNLDMLVKVINTNMANTTTGTAIDNAATTVTTSGTSGWTTGTYDVDCYMFRYRQLEEQGGSLMAFDI